MKLKEVLAALVLGMILVFTIGCARNHLLNEEVVMNQDLTWQEAKASTQAMELQIVGQIPEGQVVKVEQMSKETLFSCNKTQHNWNGATTITLVPNADIEPIVRRIADVYAGARFDITTRYNFAGKYEIHLIAPDAAENYIIGEDIYKDTIRIDSGSACFTLPKGVYPGGEF